MKRFLSLGAGVQSSTLALMIAHGEVESVDAAVFADTQAEPKAVYDWLDWLEKQLPYPVYRVSAGNLLNDVVNRKDNYNPIPAYRDGSIGRRQCTWQYKLRPLHKKMRELAGLEKGERSKGAVVTALLGISQDEIFRMKPSQFAWLKNDWPLIDKGMTRGHCLEWMRNKGYPLPPRSACVFCPYKSDDEWRHTKETDADGWRIAVEVDRLIANYGERLHRSEKPLDAVELTDLQRDFFGNECEGMCGV